MNLFRLPVEDTIYLVQPEHHMAEEMLRVLDQNRSHLSEYLDFLIYTNSVDDEKNYLKTMLENQAHQKARLFVIYDGDKLIGTIDLHAVDMNNQRAEVGYWLAKEYNGRGIMTKCVKKLAEISFNEFGLNKLRIIAEVDNIASNKVAEKAGFTFVGTDKEEVLRGNTFTDMNRYELIKEKPIEEQVTSSEQAENE